MWMHRSVHRSINSSFDLSAPSSDNRPIHPKSNPTPLTLRQQGGYFTCHGPDAAKIGREFYATDTVVRHQGACL